MTNQLNLFVLLFGALQGALLSVWFLRNQQRKVSNYFFSFFLLVIGLQLTMKVVTKVWLMTHVQFPYLLSYNFPYIIGPLLYLYVRSRKSQHFKWSDLLHFIPFLYCVALTWLSMNESLPFGLYLHKYTHATLQIISLLTYGWMSVRLGNVRLKNFIYGVVVVEVIIAITIAFMYMYYPRFPDVRLLFIVLTCLIYWISYKVVAEPDLFVELPSAPVISLGFLKSDKYAHSSLKPDEAVRIETAIHQFLDKEKLFLISTLTIDTLASRIGTSRHHLSQVFNERLGKSFLEYLNDLKLEEARRRLSDPSFYRYTIAGIALDSGFSSVSGFNDIFKKKYGTTPSKFKDQQPDQMRA